MVGSRLSLRWLGLGSLIILVMVLAWWSATAVQAQEETPTPTETVVAPTETSTPVDETPAPEGPTPSPEVVETPEADMVIAPAPIAPAPIEPAHAPRGEEETLVVPTTGTGPSGGGNMSQTLQLALGLAGGLLVVSGTANIWLKRIR
jgi:cytoskeletal protein RodZ